MMKTSNKIAPILIVLFLGIFSYPRLQAAVNHVDTINLEEDPSKKQTRFSGFIIDASPADLLLYKQQTGIAEEIHAQFVPPSKNNKPDAGSATLKNNHSNECTQPKTNNPASVACNPICIKNLTNPKK